MNYEAFAALPYCCVQRSWCSVAICKRSYW